MPKIQEKGYAQKVVSKTGNIQRVRAMPTINEKGNAQKVKKENRKRCKSLMKDNRK